MTAACGEKGLDNLKGIWANAKNPVNTSQTSLSHKDFIVISSRT